MLRSAVRSRGGVVARGARAVSSLAAVSRPVATRPARFQASATTTSLFRPSALSNRSTTAANAVRFYSPITTDTPAKELDFAAVKQFVDTTTQGGPLIVDVREPSEYAAGHIPTAVNIPFKSSPGALSLEAEDFEDTFGFAKPETDKELIFYCLAGVRSTAAEELASTFGYQK